MVLSLVVWVGGIIFFSFVLAPTLFSTLGGAENGRHLAGSVVNRSLGALHFIGIACGLIFLTCLFLYSNAINGPMRAAATQSILIFIMLAVTAFSQFAIAPRMAALRNQMGVIDDIAATDARQVEFDRWHRWSTSAEAGVLISGLVLLFLVSKEVR